MSILSSSTSLRKDPRPWAALAFCLVGTSCASSGFSTQEEIKDCILGELRTEIPAAPPRLVETGRRAVPELLGYLADPDVRLRRSLYYTLIWISSKQALGRENEQAVLERLASETDLAAAALGLHVWLRDEVAQERYFEVWALKLKDLGAHREVSWDFVAAPRLFRGFFPHKVWIRNLVRRTGSAWEARGMVVASHLLDLLDDQFNHDDLDRHEAERVIEAIGGALAHPLNYTRDQSGAILARRLPVPEGFFLPAQDRYGEDPAAGKRACERFLSWWNQNRDQFDFVARKGVFIRPTARR